jgi:hydroxypyruvate isomerase
MQNNPIKHSFCFWPCPIDTITNPLAFFKQVKAMGYSGIEMVTPVFRPIVREAGLYIVNTNGPGMVDGLNDLANHEVLIPQLQENIRLTAKDQIKANIIFTGNRKSINRTDGIRNCVKGIKALLPVAEENGVTLLLELLGEHDHPGYQGSSLDFCLAIHEMVGSKYLKLLYDVYHMEHMKADVEKELLNHISVIGHIHGATTPHRTSINQSRTVNYPNLINKAYDKGYTGYFGHEFVPQINITSELEASINAFT